MTEVCREIRRRLADTDPGAVAPTLRDDTGARAHLEECDDCLAWLEALCEVDAGLAGLAPIDAPDALVEAALAAAQTPLPEPSSAPPSAAAPPQGRPRWLRPLGSRVSTEWVAGVLAACLVLAVTWSLVPWHRADTPTSGELVARTGEAIGEETFVDSVNPRARQSPDLDAEEEAREFKGDLGDYRTREGGREGDRLRALGSVRGPEDKSQVAELQKNAAGMAGKPAELPAPAAPAAPPPRSSLTESNQGALADLERQAEQGWNQRANEAFGYFGMRADAPVPQPSASETLAVGAKRKVELHALLEDGLVSRLERSLERGAGSDDAMNLELAPDPTLVGGALHRPITSAAQRFEDGRNTLENLRFQSPSGYWDNTYVPGDPVMRWLESRVQSRDPAALQALSARPLVLEAAARQTAQPFDPPTSAALSVYVHADRPGLEGEGRMLVQVGLRGAERHSRLRPAMNVGIVLDLRGAPAPDVGARMRALVEGFLDVKSVGDGFSLTVAGRPGGTLVEADAFRHGPISVALRRLQGPTRVEPEGKRPTLDLPDALRAAAGQARRGQDPGAPLGSSLVLLVTAQPLGGLTEEVAAFAHQSAVAGVPISAVGIGEAVQQGELERVILAGQGNRRLMHTPAEATRIVERELSAQSRAIARAVRLRIRLAPGVKLVDVVGSQRLDAAGAGRARQAEQAIDRRMARNLGIEADRGEDESGIQIVIPTFYSGDAHPILLDVVAPGPGPIADVTVRYKDLVYLRNGVARANLTLGRSTAPAGPLERNVVKNYLALRTAQTLKEAGRALLAGDDSRAASLVREVHDLLAGLQRERPGFHSDGDLQTDVVMLGEYLALLDAGAGQQSAPRDYLADSLQLSGYFKTVPRPPGRREDPR